MSPLNNMEKNRKNEERRKYWEKRENKGVIERK